MKTILLLFAFLTSCSMNAQDITGQWTGILNIQVKQLRIVFHISKNDSGYISTMDSPDQGALGIPTTSTYFKNSGLKITASDLGIVYEGILGRDSITGTYKQAGRSFPLNLSKEKTDAETVIRPHDPINRKMPDSIKSHLDTIINIIQTKSLYRKNVDWTMVKDSVYSKAKYAQNDSDIIPAVQYIFKEIGDEHGGILFKGRWYRYAYEHKPLRKTLIKQVQFVVNKGELSTIIIAVLDNGYGYIRIPSIHDRNQGDDNKYAQQIQDSLCTLNPNKLKGWIIDLRLNPGGSMFPMIGGIGDLIGDGVCGGFVDPIGNTKTKWIIKSGDLYFDNQQLTKIEKRCPISELPKIAVLTGPITASSGEATAIALKGRPNTRSFGEKTSGYVTGNQEYYIDKNITLEVAVNYYADRNGVVYKHFVTPDVELIEGDDFQDLNKDVKIQAALNWLKNSH